MATYRPPPLMRNPHLQSILSSTGPRRWLARRRARALLRQARPVELNCGQGVRLLGAWSPHPAGNGRLAVLIHGWEGCADSTYLVATGGRLFDAGYDVVRLNLRDHGPTHHLNRELFNSTRVREVVGAVAALQAQLPHERLFLGGFSLGGNFALRVALHAPAAGIRLARVAAVCPVIDPARTMDQLERGPRLYHDYFRRKWRRSLRRKLALFPDLYDYGDALLGLDSLRAMNEYFVPRYTDYPDTLSYFQGYAIGGERLGDLQVPAHIITSRDDPVILYEDFAQLPQHPRISLEVTDHGGHCGFLQDWTLRSWIEQRILQVFEEAGGDSVAEVGEL